MAFVKRRNRYPVGWLFGRHVITPVIYFDTPEYQTLRVLQGFGSNPEGA